jgi:cytochrome c-type biogenesis protein CcmH
MMIFWIICALMLVIALLFVVLPLWLGNLKNNNVARDSANLEIFRDQIAEMDADLRNGLLTQDMYEQGKRELQARLVDEVGEAKSTGSVAVRNPLKVLALALIVLVPLSAVGLYWKVGNRHALLQQAGNVSADQFGSVRSESALKALEEKVAAHPEDTESLFQLARSYAEVERFTDAVQAYDKLTQVVPNEAQLWADYADVLAMASGRTLVGTPTKLLGKALAIEPDNFKALALSGSAAMERGDYSSAVGYWEKLLKLIPKEDENAKIVENGIQHARDLLAQKTGGKAPKQTAQTEAREKSQPMQGGKEAITGIVVLSDKVKAHTSPEDTLFVLVRAAQGPKMPLAILRKQVKDLPLKFTLDDSTAMSPQMKMSNFDQVVVIAKVSKSGNPMTQPGDLQGMSAVLKPGTKGLKLSIDQVAP